MKNDIQSKQDIKNFVIQFYSKLIDDQILTHFFQDIITHNHLEKHIEVIVDFWEDILLDTVKYGRNALKPHLDMHVKKPFQAHHFDAWLDHFTVTIDTNFKGKKAELAKTRALSIATVMKIKMLNFKKS